MQKSDALKVFLRKEAEDASRQFMLRSLKHLEKVEIPERKREFVHIFQELLGRCRDGAKEVRFIQITLMRSRALCNRPFYVLEAFPEELYLAEPVVSVEMDLQWLYQDYREYCEEIDQQAKKYYCLDKLILDSIKLTELIRCKRIIHYLLEETLGAIISTEEYKSLSPGEGFQIQIGEYRGPFDIVFQSNPKIERLGRWWYGVSQNHAET